jgi:crotonobetainyl-CoA:carnitine CoA-transferase CaiB-like acyl-CoA transferase
MLSLGVDEESQLPILATSQGREAWLCDPRFAKRCARAAHANALEEEIIQALSLKTSDEWERDLLANGVPVAKIRSLPESLHQTHTKARGFVHQDEGTGLGVPTLPFRLGQTAPHRPRTSAPALGEDSDKVMEDLTRSTEMGAKP